MPHRYFRATVGPTRHSVLVKESSSAPPPPPPGGPPTTRHLSPPPKHLHHIHFPDSLPLFHQLLALSANPSSSLRSSGSGAVWESEDRAYCKDLYIVDSINIDCRADKRRTAHPPYQHYVKVVPFFRMTLEEDVVFKLLCQVDKVGSLIGKGGAVVRSLETDTGASIKVIDGAASDIDERLIIISAREALEQRHSPAQEAVIRVHSKIAEIGFEPGSVIIARLLVHPHQIGCLLGNGGIALAELRRMTGASIRIFPSKQGTKYGSYSDDIMQVTGTWQSVQDALFHITSRLREMVFPVKSHFPGGRQYMPPYPEVPSPLFRPTHDPASPGYHSPVGLHRGYDRVGSDRVVQGLPFDRPSSPGSRTSQIVSGAADNGGGFAFNNSASGSENAGPSSPVTVEVVIPQVLLRHVYGENNSNLDQIRQISGAVIVVHDPRPGTTEGMVLLSGKPDQIHVAQSLIHAFIISEKSP